MRSNRNRPGRGGHGGRSHGPVTQHAACDYCLNSNHTTSACTKRYCKNCGPNAPNNQHFAVRCTRSTENSSAPDSREVLLFRIKLKSCYDPVAGVLDLSNLSGDAELVDALKPDLNTKRTCEALRAALSGDQSFSFRVVLAANNNLQHVGLLVDCLKRVEGAHITALDLRNNKLSVAALEGLRKLESSLEEVMLDGNPCMEPAKQEAAMKVLLMTPNLKAVNNVRGEEIALLRQRLCPQNPVLNPAGAYIAPAGGRVGPRGLHALITAVMGFIDTRAFDCSGGLVDALYADKITFSYTTERPTDSKPLPVAYTTILGNKSHNLASSNAGAAAGLASGRASAIQLQTQCLYPAVQRTSHHEPVCEAVSIPMSTFAPGTPELLLATAHGAYTLIYDEPNSSSRRGRGRGHGMMSEEAPLERRRGYSRTFIFGMDASGNARAFNDQVHIRNSFASIYNPTVATSTSDVVVAPATADDISKLSDFIAANTSLTKAVAWLVAETFCALQISDRAESAILAVSKADALRSQIGWENVDVDFGFVITFLCLTSSFGADDAAKSMAPGVRDAAMALATSLNVATLPMGNAMCAVLLQKHGSPEAAKAAAESQIQELSNTYRLKPEIAAMLFCAGLSSPALVVNLYQSCKDDLKAEHFL